MKKIFVLILLFVAFSAYAQTETHPPKWIETPTAWVLEGSVEGIDSNDVGNTTAFDNTPIVARIYEGLRSAWTGRDTTTLPAWKSTDIHIFIYVNGTGTVDSLAYVYYQCADVSGNWATVDTMKTRKSTGIMTTLSYDAESNLTRTARFAYAGKDLTVSGYAMRLDYQIIIPKRGY